MVWLDFSERQVSKVGRSLILVAPAGTPTNGQAYYERGGASFHKGDMPTALKDLEQACKYNYGDSCQRLQRFAQQ